MSDTGSGDPRIKELSDEAARYRVRTKEAEAEAERLRYRIVAIEAEGKVQRAKDEAETLRRQLEAVTNPTDEQLVERGLTSQKFWDDNKEAIDLARGRIADADKKAKREERLAKYNSTQGEPFGRSS